MARFLLRTEIPTFKTTLPASKAAGTCYAPRLVTLRALSSQPEKSPLADPDTDRREALVVQTIEDAIHGIIVRRSAPDWLPFVPGSSYWVPPRRGSYGIANLVEKLANTLTEEEVMSFTTSRGWPSSGFFLNEALADPVHAQKTLESSSNPEDKEN